MFFQYIFYSEPALSMTFMCYIFQDLTDQVLTVDGWNLYTWTDERLAWKDMPDIPVSVDKVRVSGDLIWIPDVILYNRYL